MMKSQFDGPRWSVISMLLSFALFIDIHWDGTDQSDQIVFFTIYPCSRIFDLIEKTWVDNPTVHLKKTLNSMVHDRWSVISIHHLLYL